MFINDYSQCCAVYFLRKSQKVLEKFEVSSANKCGEKISALHTDNGARRVLVHDPKELPMN
jgi:hypothetical protein